MKLWIKYHKLLSHSTIWIILLFININFFSSFKGFTIAFERGISLILLYSLLFYSNWFVFIPRLYIKKRYLWFSISVITAVIVTSIIRIIIEQHFGIIRPLQRSPLIVNKELRGFFLAFSFSSFIFIVSTMLRMANYYSLQSKQKDILLQEKTAAELQLLKAQINPHFLFNALNNIYALVLIKSDNAADSLMSLSQLLRYIIYDASGEKVALDKEIRYLQYYIDLESLRLTNKQALNYNPDINSANYTIMPLTFIPFIENSFKHSDVNKGGFIKIDLTLKGNLLYFSCKNSFSEKTVDSTGGIGMENSLKRLEIMYAGRHELNIKKENNVFSVELSLEL